MGDEEKIGIRATYWINNGSEESPTRIQSFGPSTDESAETHVTVNTPHKVDVDDKTVIPQAGETSFSGRHDTGPLPPLKEGGPMAILMNCVQQAKDFNDAYLTEQIELAKKKASPPVKKAKVEDDSS